LLEDRTLPVSNFFVTGSTLIISGPTTPRSPGEVIVIQDNGGNGLNNVTASGDGVPFRPNAVISNISVTTGRGNDNIVYNLNGDLTASRNLSINTGGGQDHVTISLRGNVLNGAAFAMNVVGGAGNDVLTINQVGLINTGSKVTLMADMGAGNDVINAFTGGLIAAGASMAVNFEGGPGADRIFFVFNGQSNGMQSLNIDGGPGNDNIFADYELNDQSTGTILPSLVEGGDGDDILSLIVHNRGTGFTNDQVIDGGNGIDHAFRTPAVVTSNVEIDTVVP
jgi:hypothetical protein